MEIKNHKSVNCFLILFHKNAPLNHSLFNCFDKGFKLTILIYSNMRIISLSLFIPIHFKILHTYVDRLHSMD